MKHSLNLLALAALLTAAPAPAAAGIIVMKSGKVLVGGISAEDVTEDSITLHPLKRGDDMKVERHLVRWFSLEDDTLPDAYWERFADAKIEKAYVPLLEKWRVRQRQKVSEVPIPDPDPELLGTHTVHFPAADGLPVTAELYGGSDKTRPFIILCHQARSSRGEYRPIAPRLLELGFACLALDQRSGRGMNDVPNETASRAAREGKSTDYPAARQDIEAAIKWVRDQGYTGTLTLWGSSYSASLALMIGASNEAVSAVVAFSPGDYLRPKGTVAAEAKALARPLLIVAPEGERSQATALAEVIPSESKTLFINATVVHGSRTLYVPPDADAAPIWKAVLAFLEAHGR